MFAVWIKSQLEPAAAWTWTVLAGIAKSVADMVRLAREADILGAVFRIDCVRRRAGGQQ